MKHVLLSAFILACGSVGYAQSNYSAPYTFTTLAGSSPNQGSQDGAGSSARFYDPSAMAVDGSGTIYVADTDNDTIRKITPSGVVSTFAGSPGKEGYRNGLGAAARFYAPVGIAIDANGNLFVADAKNDLIRKITPDGMVSDYAGTPLNKGQSNQHKNGRGRAATFAQPEGIAVDANGNVYVADTFNQLIRKITPDRMVTSMAGRSGNDNQGSNDGKGFGARFYNPYALAVDAAGNVYVADSGNDIVRKISPDRVVTTLAGTKGKGDTSGNEGSQDGMGGAAGFSGLFGVAVDPSGNVYVADTQNHTIRKVTPDGVVTTLGGSAGNSGSNDGTGVSAQFYSPAGIAVDAQGTVYVADTSNQTIRVGTPARK